MSSPDPLSTQVTAAPSMSASPPLPPAEDSASALPSWGKPALMVAGSLVMTETAASFLHLDIGSILGLGAMAGGWWLLGRGRRSPRPRLPATLSGWIDRCEGLLGSFERLEGEPNQAQASRLKALEGLRELAVRPGLGLVLVSSRPPEVSLQPDFAHALRCPLGLTLHWGHPLPQWSATWQWPLDLAAADAVLHHLELPLRATDLRWLEALPQKQPVWLLVQGGDDPDRERLRAEVASLWPAADPGRLLHWNGASDTIETSLRPLASWLAREGSALRQATPLRCLETLHGRWQAELEGLRRREWRQLQQRTQWLVAAGVVASPLPSVDLLVLAAANGLMLQEMARLWECPWTLEQLRSAAVELSRACLAMGVVEWSSQALAATGKLHGATWLMGSTLQALSAAYLTRVVGRAMADVLALSAGVSEPDLEAIRRQAPLLVARAAEAEKLDWSAFLQQARQWLGQQGSPPSSPLLQGNS